MENKTRIFFRADGNSRIGLGHLIRSLALAAMLKPEFTCCFLLKDTLETLYPQISEAATYKLIPSDLRTEEEPAALLQNFLQPGDVLVLDGYQFDTSYQEKLKAGGVKLVCIDDLHAFPFVAEALINVAGGITVADYDAQPETRFLFGPAYCLLRPPFLEAARLPVSGKDFTKLFLNLGGADPENTTQQILEELTNGNYEFAEIHVVLGPAYLHQETLLGFLQNNHTVKIHRNLSADEMCRLMQQCGMAICPPSGVSYEYCTVRGLLFLYQTAGNQTGIRNYLLQNSLALPYEELKATLNDQANLKETAGNLIRNQQRIFDGMAPERYRNFFKSL